MANSSSLLPIPGSRMIYSDESPNYHVYHPPVRPQTSILLRQHLTMLGPGKRNGSHYSFHKHKAITRPSISITFPLPEPSPAPRALPCPGHPAPYPQVAVGDVGGREGGVERLFPVDFNDAPVLDIAASRGRAVSRRPASTGSLPAPALHPRPPCCSQTTNGSVLTPSKKQKSMSGVP